MKNWKRLGKRVMAASLSASLTICAIQFWPKKENVIQAATQNYVKDVAIGIGEAGKKDLEKKGYTVVSQDLNEGGGNGTDKVYLGYHTTTVAKQAITDLALMNMNGNYSYTDYEAIIEQRKTDALILIEHFREAIREYQKNVKDKKPRALRVKETLNKFYEDDTNLLLGDLFLKPEVLDEKNEEMNKALLNILTQSSEDMVAMIQTTLADALDTSDDDTLKERLEETVTYDEMLDEADITSKEEEKRYIKENFGDSFSSLSIVWETFRQKLVEYEEKGVPLDLEDGNEADISEYIETLPEEEVVEYLNMGNIYSYLKATEVELNDGDKTTLLELFMTEFDDVNQEDLYMFLAGLSEGQKGILGYIGLEKLFTTSDQKELEDNKNKNKNDYKEVESQLDELQTIQEKVLDGCLEEQKKVFEQEEKEGGIVLDKKEDAISVYEGVDRSFFTNDVAITSEATAKQNSNKSEPSWASNLYKEQPWVRYAMYAVTGVAAIATVAIWIKVGLSTGEASAKAITKAYDVAFKAAKAAGATNKQALVLANSAKEAASATQITSKGLKVAGTVVGAVFAILLAATLYLEISDYLNEHNPEYTTIPRKIVHATAQKGKATQYCYYSVVTAPKSNADDPNEEAEAADLNAFCGHEWLALYSTKDSAAGKPILAENFGKCLIGGTSGMQLTDKGLHMFGKNNIQNLTDPAYTFSNDKKGIYFTYKTSDVVASQASVFSYINKVIIASGVILLLVIVFIVRNKRKKVKA